MAVALYYRWDAQGRPWRPATPVKEFVAKLKAGYPRGAGVIWTLGNEEHLQAEPPQDHTPFAETGWPLPTPYPVVFAFDVMHRPDLGLDCHKLFAYWLAEAKAGRTPWLKYLIWQGKRYDVRNNWVPVGASGHFDHIHASFRTDHETTSIGAWSPVPSSPTVEEYEMPYQLLTPKGSVYVVTGEWDHTSRKPVLVPQTDWDLCLEWQAGGMKLVKGTKEIDPAAWDMDGIDNAITLTPEQMAELVAEVSAAAKAGAEAGSPTEAELVEAAREGAELASDS